MTRSKCFVNMTLTAVQTYSADNEKGASLCLRIQKRTSLLPVCVEG